MELAPSPDWRDYRDNHRGARLRCVTENMTHYFAIRIPNSNSFEPRIFAVVCRYQKNVHDGAERIFDLFKLTPCD